MFCFSFFNIDVGLNSELCFVNVFEFEYYIVCFFFKVYVLYL